jgi:hypothetical protein
MFSSISDDFLLLIRSLYTMTYREGQEIFIFYCSNLLIFPLFFVKIREDGGLYVYGSAGNHIAREKGITDGKKSGNGIEGHTMSDHQTGR